MWEDKLKKLLDNIELDKNNKMVTIVGAGASVGSGLKSFRGEDGMYKDKSSMELASRKGFEDNPELVWSWYKKRMQNVFEANPNPIHTSLVKLEQNDLISYVITQNVDGLHRRAGQSDEHLIEIHGTISKTHCLDNCGVHYSLSKPPTEVPVKCECGSFQRPSVVWFGETLNISDLSIIEKELQKTPLVLVIGTSGFVTPVARFPYFAKNNGAKIIEFNIKKTPFYSIDDLFIKGPAEETFEQFTNIILDKVV